MLRTFSERLYDTLTKDGIDAVGLFALLNVLVCIVYTYNIDRWDDETPVHKVRVVCTYVSAVALSAFALSRYV